MASIEFAPEVTDDFDSIIEHLTIHQVDEIQPRMKEILAAMSVLELNPLIGGPVEGNKRELVTGQRSPGYIALYRYIFEIDTVFVLAVRDQKESGYARQIT